MSLAVRSGGARIAVGISTALLARCVDRVLEAHHPVQAAPAQFLGTWFDVGLAWLDFPEGTGGKGIAASWRPFVERRFRDAGAPNPLRSFIGVGMWIYTLENHYVDADGETVVTERWRLIETASTVEAR